MSQLGRVCGPGLTRLCQSSLQKDPATLPHTAPGRRRPHRPATDLPLTLASPVGESCYHSTLCASPLPDHLPAPCLGTPFCRAAASVLGPLCRWHCHSVLSTRILLNCLAVWQLQPSSLPLSMTESELKEILIFYLIKHYMVLCVPYGFGFGSLFKKFFPSFQPKLPFSSNLPKRLPQRESREAPPCVLWPFRERGVAPLATSCESTRKVLSWTGRGGAAQRSAPGVPWQNRRA